MNFSYYNHSPINPSSFKPHFNILLDDSAGLNESMELLCEFLDYLERLDCFDIKIENEWKDKNNVWISKRVFR